MKALDIMEAAGGIDDEIIKGGHIGYAGKEYRKTPSREADASHRADRGGARARACRERPLAAGRLINSPAQAVKVARQEIAKMQDMGILSSEYRFLTANRTISAKRRTWA